MSGNLAPIERELGARLGLFVAGRLTVAGLSAWIRDHAGELGALPEDRFAIVDQTQRIINRVAQGELSEAEAPGALTSLHQFEDMFK